MKLIKNFYDKFLIVAAAAVIFVALPPIAAAQDEGRIVLDRGATAVAEFPVIH